MTKEQYLQLLTATIAAPMIEAAIRSEGVVGRTATFDSQKTGAIISDAKRYAERIIAEV